MDAKGRVEDMNEIAEVLTGFKVTEARHQPLQAIVNLQSARDGNLANSVARLCLSLRTVQRGDESVILRRRDGVHYGIDYSMSPLGSDGAGGAVLLLRDVTARRQAAKAARWTAGHDELTKLANHATFEARLSAVLEQESTGIQTQHGLCVIEIDQFGFINETYGVAAGNLVLQRLSEELQRKIRGVDLLARLDGNRFGILLLHCPFDKTKLIAETLRQEIETLTCAWHDTEIKVRASIGIAEVLPRNGNSTELLAAIDQACLKARQAGGNRVKSVIGSSQELARNSHVLTQFKEIQTALYYDRFELYCQSLLPIASDVSSLNYCELVLRMRCESGEMLAPRELLIATAGHHLLPELDRCMSKVSLKKPKPARPDCALK